MEKIRLGIVGLGHRGRHMLRLAAEKFDFVEAAAACDIDGALWHETQWLQEKPLCRIFPGMKFYENYRQMLDESRLDVVLVETGADVHAGFCILALQKDIHVFSDIPSVANLKEAGLLWRAEQSSRAGLMTGANPNEWGFVNALVDLYQQGLLGEPYYLEAEYIHAAMSPEVKTHLTAHSPWRKSLPPIRYCTHSLGPLLRIVKEDLRFVSCFGTGKHIDPAAERDDMMTALFRTGSGVVIRLLRNGNCCAPIGHHSYRVFGTAGYFERIDARGKTPPATRFSSTRLYGANTLTELPVDTMAHEYAANAASTGHGGADFALLDHMFKALRAGEKEFPISLKEGLRMTLPGIYAAESAGRGGEVLRMTYPWDEDWSEGITPYIKKLKKNGL